MRICIVEDNKPLADGIAKSFQSDGHGVDQLHDGAQAISFLTNEEADLIILDINLPGNSGLEVLKNLRDRKCQTPVLMLSARDAIDDKIASLDQGADDYLTKPFDLSELKARARALLRRAEKHIHDVVSAGNLVLDFEARQMQINDTIITLPRREFALAEILIRGKGRIISKLQILNHLYGVGADTEENAVEIYIHRLRKRLTGSGTEIKTARGLGYCFREI